MVRKHGKEKHSEDENKVDENLNTPEPGVVAADGNRSVEELNAALNVAAQEVTLLKDKLAEAQVKLDEYRDQSLRAMADFQNLRRRMEREQVAANQSATANVIRRYLEIFDDMERALKHAPKDEEAKQWVEGVELAYRKFLNYLEAEGVTMIQAEGMPFDPNQHEAISQEDSPDHESGTVIGVVQQGYRLGDRVLRPARVRVAR